MFESGVGRKLVQKKILVCTDNKIALNFFIVVLLFCFLIFFILFVNRFLRSDLSVCIAMSKAIKSCKTCQGHHLCPEMHAMANLAILTKSCNRFDYFGSFGNCDESGEIPLNYQTQRIAASQVWQDFSKP